ncbi:MAG: hypothetical protein ACRCZG_01700, partial [Culicoidibacterales bacterium]
FILSDSFVKGDIESGSEWENIEIRGERGFLFIKTKKKTKKMMNNLKDICEILSKICTDMVQ